MKIHIMLEVKKENRQDEGEDDDERGHGHGGAQQCAHQ